MASDILDRKLPSGQEKELALYLTHEIAMRNPLEECKVVGDPKLWDGLPKRKSLRYSPDGCGLAIGDITSQLFSNVYLNPLDQFCKRTLAFRHYGRYVDDAYSVNADRDILEKSVPVIKDFLKNSLKLDLHMGKTRIYDVRHGVEFLGAFLKPNRRYISNQSLQRMRKRETDCNAEHKHSTISSMLSRTGVMSHYSAHNIRKHLFKEKVI